MRRRLGLALALAAMTAGPAWAGLFDDEGARRQINELKASLDARYDTHSKALVDLLNQIQSLRDENAKLRGQVETALFELEQAKKRQQDFYVDLDGRLRKLEPQAAGAETPAKVNSDQQAESREYEEALNFFKAGKYKEAGNAFAAFVSNRVASPLAPSAQFWLGSAYYAQRDCKRAVEAQNVLVAKWPNSPKAPEAMLAIATCQAEAGNPGAAKRTLEALLAAYPEAPAADTARQRLKKK